MILSGLEIERRLGSDIVIDPYDRKLLNPNSYNLRLSDESPTLDMATPNDYERISIPPEGLVLQTGRLYLGRTMEFTATENLVPMLEGRSSVGRLGLFIHITAGFGDVGFRGFWTLEIICVQPVRVYSGVEICQIFYHTLEGKYENYKSGKYQNNQGIQPSMLYKDFPITKDSPK